MHSTRRNDGKVLLFFSSLCLSIPLWAAMFAFIGITCETHGITGLIGGLALMVSTIIYWIAMMVWLRWLIKYE
jgi:hypothetical protein